MQTTTTANCNKVVMALRDANINVLSKQRTPTTSLGRALALIEADKKKQTNKSSASLLSKQSNELRAATTTTMPKTHTASRGFEIWRDQVESNDEDDWKVATFKKKKNACDNLQGTIKAPPPPPLQQNERFSSLQSAAQRIEQSGQSTSSYKSFCMADGPKAPQRFLPLLDGADDCGPKLERLGTTPKMASVPPPSNFVKAVGSAFVDVARSKPYTAGTHQPSGVGEPVKRPGNAGKAVTESMTYGQALRAHAKSDAPDGPTKAEAVLQDMLNMYYAGVSTEAPEGSCYNIVIHAFAKQRKPEKAEAILRLMWEDFNMGNLKAEPNVRIYTSVLYAWEKSRFPEAPERCELILERMYKLYKSGQGALCKPDLYAYTVCLHCWADSTRDDAAERAEQLFTALRNHCREGDKALQPDTVAYTNLMNVYCNAPNGAVRAEALLWEMVHDYTQGNKAAKPLTRCFNTILALWSKAALPTAPERIEEILQRWDKLYRSGVVECAPDKYSYSLLLKAWASSQRSDAAKRAEWSLSWMAELYQDGVTAARPDLIKYTTVLSSLAHAGLSSRAEQLLETMIQKYSNGEEHSKPDNKCFNTVLASWSRSGNNKKYAAIRAEGLIRRMWVLNESHVLDLRPDSWMYNTAIFCWKNANDPVRCESMLREMERLYDRGLLAEGPGTNTFQAVIQAWKYSSHVDKPSHVKMLESEMNNRVDWANDSAIAFNFDAFVGSILND